MSDSRKKILGMLAEGKISVDEASMLLEKLSAAAEEAPTLPEHPAPTDTPPSPKNPRYLRVVVNSSDGDKVNIRVPLSLIRTGIKLGSLVPREAAETVKERGIDLSSLSGLDEAELAKSLAELKVDVDSSDGDVVRIFAE